MKLGEVIKSLDWVLTGTALLLVALGFIMLLSTTSQDTVFSNELIRQTISLVIALGLYLVVSFFPYHHLRRYAIPLFGAGLVVLALTSFIAPIIRGTSSRIVLAWGLQFQSSEFMKIALIIMLAAFFTKRRATARNVVISSFIAGAAALLVIAEPDIGEAALMIGAWVGLIIYLGTSWNLLSLIGVFGLGGFMGAWRWYLAPYQKARIITFIDPTSDPLGAGYNITQSIVALGSGGLIGRGLGHGPQSQLKFLPEQHTDFILASIGEELGLLGVFLLIILYVIMLSRIIRISNQTKDPFGQYLAVGVFLLLLMSLVVSAGMNMGLLPVTGIPLPLVSYGGSSLVSTLVLLGIAQSVHVYNTWVRNPPREIKEFT